MCDAAPGCYSLGHHSSASLRHSTGCRILAMLMCDEKRELKKGLVPRPSRTCGN